MLLDVAFDESAAVARIEAQVAELDAQQGRLSRAWRQVGSEYLADQRVRFDANSAGGREWPKLAKSTVAAKGSSVILVENGRLELSLAEQQPGNVFRPVANGIDVGTADPNAKYHQYGTTRMPRRRVLAPPSGDARAQIAELLRRAVVDVLKIGT